MKNILLILLVFIMSCDSKDKILLERNNSDYAMYGLMMEKYSNSIISIQQEIYNTVNDFQLAGNKTAKKYDSLTHNYKIYLENINQKIIDMVVEDSQSEYKGASSDPIHINQLFFVDDGFSQLGEEYITKRENYKNEVLKLVQRKYLNNRISQALSTGKESDRDGKKVEYLNFYFRDIPPISVMFYNRYIQYSILEFENEFMKSIILQEI